MNVFEYNIDVVSLLTDSTMPVELPCLHAQEEAKFYKYI
jgi:hypothetical protein